MAEVARNAFVNRNYLLAAEMYERCLKENTSSVDIQLGLADSLAKCGKFREALDVYSYCYKNSRLTCDNLKHVTHALIDSVLIMTASPSKTLMSPSKSMTSPSKSMMSSSSSSSSKLITSSTFLCIICEDMYNQPVTLLCGHTMCKKCEIKFKSCKKCGGNKIFQVKETNVLIKNLIEKFWPHLLNSSKLKQEGNEDFQNGNLEAALQKYNQAFALTPDSVTVLSNRSHVLLRLNRPQAALHDAEQAVKIKPSWGKAYYRKGMALSALGRHGEALQALGCCVALDRSPVAVKHDIALLLHRLLLPSTRGRGRGSPSPTQGPYWRAKRQGTSNFSRPVTPRPSGYSDCEDSGPEDDFPLSQMSRGQPSQQQLQSNSRLHGVLDHLFQTVEKFKRNENPSEDVNNWVTQTVVPVEMSDFDCVLCCRLLWRPVTTPCGHTYCWTCLDRCLDYSHACPLCMAPLADYLASSHRSVTEFVDRLAFILLPEEYNARRIQDETDLIASQIEKESRVPVFVCTTAFPTVPCPLFVYEPRYRLMVRRAVESGKRQFGIAACVDQSATGTSKYAEYGTMLEIRDQLCMANGCSILATVGCKRFRVIEGGENDGYDLAKVEFLVDDHPDNLEGLSKLHDVVRLKATYWVSTLSIGARAEVSQTFGEMPGVETDWAMLPDGPAWTWWLLAILPLGNKLKVGILGTTSLDKRLRAIDKTLDHLARQHLKSKSINISQNESASSSSN